MSLLSFGRTWKCHKQPQPPQPADQTSTTWRLFKDFCSLKKSCLLIPNYININRSTCTFVIFDPQIGTRHKTRSEDVIKSAVPSYKIVLVDINMFYVSMWNCFTFVMSSLLILVVIITFQWCTIPLVLRDVDLNKEIVWRADQLIALSADTRALARGRAVCRQMHHRLNIPWLFFTYVSQWRI